MNRHMIVMNWKFGKSPTHGQVKRLIKDAAIEFYGLTAEERFDFKGHSSIHPFIFAEQEVLFRRLDRHNDLGDPEEFASALAWERLSDIEDILWAMGD